MAAGATVTAPEAPTTRPKAHAGASAQVNARIDPELKRRGDEGLAAAGLTATQAVRALWSLAASCADDPGRLRAALLPEEVERERQEREAERQRKIRLAREGADIVKNALIALGIDPPRPGEHSELSYEELKELAYRERFPEFFETPEA